MIGLTAWLHYLETLPSGLNNNSLVGVKSIAQKLGLLSFSGKIIVVGGTNGKGSCVVFLEAILLAAGLKTGAFLSPHVLRYNERIRLNGKDIDDATLCQIFTQIENARGDTVLSYFEFSTLTALAIFKKKKIDVLILEVGLGGRFDAVNILDADIAVITTISLDHTKILGNTREAIGREKAGIMRAFKPVICGDANVPKSIYAVAKQTKAILYSPNEDFGFMLQNGYWCWYSAKNKINKLPWPKLPIASARVALMVIKLLQKDLKIPKKAIVTGLKKAFLPGRLQRIIVVNKEIIFDVAHNPESAALLAQNLVKQASKGRSLAVLSMLSDKNITATLKPLTKIVDKWYLGALTGSRATSTKQLTRCLAKAGASNFVALPTVARALQQAIAECGIKDRIVVLGSFHTVAESLKFVGD
ncbi:bifunctional folylpolyglutamate synthetase/dihydrofolate synthetase [Gammaproteobacteria bacterium]